MDFGKLKEIDFLPKGESLSELFNQILSEGKRWNYYQENDNNQTIEQVIFNSGDFIKKYLKNGRKLPEESLNNYFQGNEFRLSHTVSIFFLGILLYESIEIIKTNINIYLSELEFEIIKCDPKGDFISLPFQYYWFLMCFYHDFGYFVVSKNNEEFKLFEDKGNWKDVEKEVGKIVKELKPLGYKIPSFIKSTCLRYLTYKKKISSNWIPKENLDHGIISGTSFYYQRKTKYNELFSKSENKGKKSLIDEFGLHWSKHLLEQVHTSVSWNIISHNIWFVRDNSPDSVEYRSKENKLGKLVVGLNDPPPVKINKFPMYFLLCLVDTIDPVKKLLNRTKDVEEQTLDVLQKVHFIKNTPTSFYIILDNKLNYDKFLEIFNNTDFWLGITIETEKTNRKILITIKT